MQYRRLKTPGGTYFFTVATFARRKILCEPENRALLRTAIRLTQTRHPFVIDAFVLLPDHLHTIWTLPLDDTDYSMRWNTIKSYFSKHCLHTYKSTTNTSQKKTRTNGMASSFLGTPN